MSFDTLQALRAYGSGVSGAVQTPNAPQESGDSDFSTMVGSALRDASATLTRAETLSSQAAAGRAELVDVVTAVAAAEVTLETVISVRDQVVQAYQEVLRMPI